MRSQWRPSPAAVRPMLALVVLVVGSGLVTFPLSGAQAQEEKKQEEKKPEASSTRVALGVIVVQTPEGHVGVWRVPPRSPAAQAGLQPGDEILQLDDQAIHSPKELLDLIAQKRAGDRVQVTFLRNGVEQTVTVRLIRRDEMASARQERRAARRAHEEEGEEGKEETRPPAEAAEPWLGLILGEAEKEGVRVNRVVPNSPAAQAGVRRGDLLQRLDDQKIQSSDDAAEVLRGKKPGETLQLQILRDEKEQTLKATLTAREGLGDGPRFRPERLLERLEDLQVILHQLRHSGEQNERIQRALEDLKREVQDLRHEVEDLKKETAQAQKK